MLSAKDVFEYPRVFARLLDMPFGRQEVTIDWGSAAADDAPIIHRAVAVIDEMDPAFAVDRDVSS